LEEAPEIRIFGMKEASKGLLQFLRETQVGFAQAERERRESEWGNRGFGSGGRAVIQTSINPINDQ
jgi:hypothetical protein